jgi:hypothetical protein
MRRLQVRDVAGRGLDGPRVAVKQEERNGTAWSKEDVDKERVAAFVS